jgi:HlyD family secretion protein
MKNKNLLIFLAALVVVLLIVAIVGKKQNWFGKGDLQTIALEKVAFKSIIETVTASGKLNPQTEVKLSSEVSGEIIELRVKEGDSVKKGDLLVVINPAIYESQEAQASATVSQVRANRQSAEATFLNQQSQFDQAKATYERQQKLYADKIISVAEYEQAKVTLRAAQAAFETAKEQFNASKFSLTASEAQRKLAVDNLLKTRIYAPISGIISLCNVKLGERVVGTAQMAGTELIRVADLNNMQAEVDVNENDVLKVKVGDTADIEVDAYRNKKFKGVVSQIAYSSGTSQGVVATSQAINFTVKISLLKDSYTELIDPLHGHAFPFRPGMSCTVDVRTNTKDKTLSVPIQSVTTRENEKEKGYKQKKDEESTDKKDVKEVVFVIESGKAKMIEVKTGIQDASYIEILSGLKDGQEVIKAPFKAISKTLKDGDLVKVVEESELFKDAKEEK